MMGDLIFRIARETQQEAQEYRPRPSGWGSCIRASTYHALGYPPKDFPGRFVVLLEESSFGEELVADWIRKTAWRLHSQQLRVMVGATNGSKEIHGSIDGIIEDLLGNEYLWESKRLNHFSFERIENALSGGVWDEIVVKYINQMVAYLVGLGRLSEINRGVLLIQNRNTLAFLEIVGIYHATEDAFTIESALSTRISDKSDTGIFGEIEEAHGMVLPGVFAGFLAHFNRIEEYVAAKTLPARPYAIDHFMCSYCRWRDTCWSGYEAELAARAPESDMPEELEPMVQEYRDLADTEGKCDKRKKELKSILLNECEAQGIKKCRSPRSGLSLSLSLRGRDIIDPDLVPAAIREKATKRVEWQQIDVRKPKGAKA